jgi:hypothetical protein
MTTIGFPCDPLGDHMARCTDPECQVCHAPCEIPSTRAVSDRPVEEMTTTELRVELDLIIDRLARVERVLDGVEVPS